MGKGKIFDIQSFSTHDGPGIRTVVFFQGCNLRCKWCHNPESWEFDPHPIFLKEKCIGCRACLKICPALNEIGSIDSKLCNRCRACIDVCYAGALSCSCREFSPMELWTLISTDKPYFENGGGGVTFSGGECMLQSGFLEEIIKICKENNVHTAIDTAGNVPYEFLEKAAPDLFLYDIKASSPIRHKILTGVDGILIWENLLRLYDNGFEIIVRIPCVPEANIDELQSIKSRLFEIGINKIELLPYHNLGEDKATLHGIEKSVFNKLSMDEMDHLKNDFYKQ